MLDRSVYSLLVLVTFFFCNCAATKPKNEENISNREYERGLDYSVQLYSKPINIFEDEASFAPLSQKSAAYERIERSESKPGSLRFLKEKMAVQIASFRSENNAKSYLHDVSDGYSDFQFSVIYSSNLWRIVVDNLNSRFEAESVRDNLRKTGFPDAWIIRF